MDQGPWLDHGRLTTDRSIEKNTTMDTQLTTLPETHSVRRAMPPARIMMPLWGVMAVLSLMFLLSSCKSKAEDKGLALQHTADCKYKTPEALSQSLALCLRDADFTCANQYLPGVGDVLGIESTNTNDTAAQEFGAKAEHMLVTALKKEIITLREEITAKGGDISKLQLMQVTQNDKDVVLQIVLHLKATPIEFTMKPVGLFQNEANWYLLGSKFEVVYGAPAAQ